MWIAEALRQVQPQIAEYITKIPKSQIVIEGHTDNQPVSNAVIGKAHFCAVYDDNLTLSSARAREARKLLLGKLDEKSARRIVVAGYGDFRPLAGIKPSVGHNRRIEIRFNLTEDEN